MQIQTHPQPKKDGLLFYLFMLTGFFFLLEISFFIQCNKAYLSDFTFVSDHIHIPWAILPGIFYFIFAQLCVHFIYCLLVWQVAVWVTALFGFSFDRRLKLAIFIWIVGVVTILVANQYLYPNSKFASLTSFILTSSVITKHCLNFLCMLIGVLLSLASIGLLKNLKRKIFFYLFLLMGVGPLLGFYFLPSQNIMTVKDAATSQKPNIILIGVDSLRPDFLSYFGSEYATPFFDSFLKQATVFNEAVTPLARTYPSWMSILSGQYPSQINVRSNLASQKKSQFSHLLPIILREQGYETIFATDETRFSNIDHQHGFNEIVTPPMGLNDFLIGTFNDFPLSNLLINTRMGRWFFPHSYANRPVYFAYEPDSFLELLRQTLNRPREKPMFLAVHFCLTHYPYLWASLSGRDYDILVRYRKSVSRVDRQIHDFYMMLREYGFLNHAIVVLLSDHGEALELPGDRITEQDLFQTAPSLSQKAIPKFYPPGLDNEELNRSAGHGTDVLGLPQYHTVLAFQLHGLGKWHKGMRFGVVSLVDIKPTILDLIHLDAASDKESESLLTMLKGEQETMLKPRHIFLESDFSPEAIRTVYPETRQVMLEGIELFQIDPKTTRLTVKDKMMQMIVQSKQYADIYDNWMLALYPQETQHTMPILINLNTGKWTNDLHSAFALHSPAALMLSKLKDFYGDEIKYL